MIPRPRDGQGEGRKARLPPPPPPRRLPLWVCVLLCHSRGTWSHQEARTTCNRRGAGKGPKWARPTATKLMHSLDSLSPWVGIQSSPRRLVLGLGNSRKVAQRRWPDEPCGDNYRFFLSPSSSGFEHFSKLQLEGALYRRYVQTKDDTKE